MRTDIKLDIFDDSLVIYGKSLLSILLKDRTTGKNIIWATNDYVQLGDIYSAENEISLYSINGKSEKFIRPRITKSYEKQSIRTREKAEVFTPSWVCNKQNNLIDEQWFGRKDVFNIETDKGWLPNKGKIKFESVKGKTWKKYVDVRRMEITCGEAPYLVSRYDAVTGEIIDLQSRIGLLDRKLRIVNENTDNEKDWLKWAERAYQSIYGYEFQGDNLLLARENLLNTFIDNIKYKLEREPRLNELKKIATIISWNIWQMDGLNHSIPLSAEQDEFMQMSLFNGIENNDKSPAHKYCRIKNWRSKAIIEYRSLVGGQSI